MLLIIVRSGDTRTHQTKHTVGAAKGAPVPGAMGRGLESRKARSELLNLAMKRYEETVTALESARSGLPDLATLVVTTDRHRQSELQKSLGKCSRLIEGEPSARRAVERIGLSKHARENLAPLYRRGSENRESIKALCERAEQLFDGDLVIPGKLSVLSAEEEKTLFRALQGYRERYLLALHMVPFIQERVVDFLASTRDEGKPISQVVVTKRSRSLSETQVSNHVEANLATVRGILRREGEISRTGSSEKIAKLLVETPLSMERLSKVIKELGLRTRELEVLEEKLRERHNGAPESAPREDPDYALYLQRVRELGGSGEFARTQYQTLNVLREPYQRIQDYILNANRRLVGKWVNSLIRSGASQEDLMQEATIGLMRAVEKYDVDTGLKFSTVASWWIMQAVKRKRLMNHGAMEIPGYQLPAIARLSRFDAEHNAVSATEAAKRLDLRPEMVRVLRSVQRPVVSLSARSKRADGAKGSIADLLPSSSVEAVTDAASRGELRSKLESVFKKIQPRLVQILRMRFGLEGSPMTLAEVGEKMRLTRERVRQLEAKALKKLQIHSKSEALEEFVR